MTSLHSSKISQQRLQVTVACVRAHALTTTMVDYIVLLQVLLLVFQFSVVCCKNWCKGFGFSCIVMLSPIPSHKHFFALDQHWIGASLELVLGAGATSLWKQENWGTGLEPAPELPQQKRAKRDTLLFWVRVPWCIPHLYMSHCCSDEMSQQIQRPDHNKSLMQS